jgi:uncharacterized membrane protein HdeD (DUF308 family)
MAAELAAVGGIITAKDLIGATPSRRQPLRLQACLLLLLLPPLLLLLLVMSCACTRPSAITCDKLYLLLLLLLLLLAPCSWVSLSYCWLRHRRQQQWWALCCGTLLPMLAHHPPGLLLQELLAKWHLAMVVLMARQLMGAWDFSDWCGTVIHTHS